MYFNGNIRTAIQEHGEAWKDYFSLEITEMDEFHDQPLPGVFRPNQERIQQELAGSCGLQRESKRKKGQVHGTPARNR